MEPTPPSEEELRQRQEMLDALAEAVDNEDVEFVNQIAAQQTLLRPFEIAEYMDVKRRHAEDPVESRRWEDALRAYLDQLRGSDFPQEEAEVLNGLVSSLEFEAIATNTDVSYIDEYHEANESDEGEEEDYDWDDDKFGIDIERSEMDRIRRLPVFQHAETLARGSSTRRPDLPAAISHIEAYVQSDLQSQMRIILDHYVFLAAERLAAGSSTRSPDFGNAHSVVEAYSSDEEVESRMKSALDKYVFKTAERAAQGSSVRNPDLSLAKNLIEAYASRPGRRYAMLRQLGFI